MARKPPTPEADANQSEDPKNDFGARETIFSSDRPLDEIVDDRLGFRVVAARLAASLLSQSPQEGYVVAIEGAWGSGKSTLVNFVSQELAAAEKNRPEVVRFEPWIGGGCAADACSLCQKRSEARHPSPRTTARALCLAGNE